MKTIKMYGNGSSETPNFCILQVYFCHLNIHLFCGFWTFQLFLKQIFKVFKIMEVF